MILLLYICIESSHHFHPSPKHSAKSLQCTEVSVLTSEGLAPYLTVPFPFESNEARLKAGRHLGASFSQFTAQQDFGAQPKEQAALVDFVLSFKPRLSYFPTTIPQAVVAIPKQDLSTTHADKNK